MSDQGAAQRPATPHTKDRVLLRGKVVKLVREGQFDQAVALVTSVLESEDVPTQETLLWRARVFEQSGRHLEALADADAALLRRGDDAITAHKYRAKALRALGRTAEALAADAAMAQLAKPSPAAQNAFWSFMEGAITGNRKRELTYVVGNAQAPDDHRGQDRLWLTEGDQFEVRNERQTLTQVWRGRLRPGLFAEIEGRIKASTFPQFPTQPPIAGAALRELSYQGRCALLPVNEPGLPPEAHALYAALDDLVNAIKAGVATSDIEQVTREHAPST